MVFIAPTRNSSCWWWIYSWIYIRLMAYLNANIPIIECYVRGNYLRDQKDSHDKYFEVGNIWF